MKVFRLINRVMAFAVDKGYLGKAPKPRIIFDINNKIESVLTEPQIQELLKKARESGNEWYAVWAVALYTGMRSGELYALRWSKVDLNEGLIKVCESWGSKNGFKGTKGKKDRFVDIAPPLGKLLKEMRERSPNDEFVLPRIPSWKNGAQSKRLREFLVKNGLPSIRFHDLRASWATLLLRLGVTPAQVMTAAGWEEFDTMDRYIRTAGIDVKGMSKVLKL
jgi:integrase